MRKVLAPRPRLLAALVVALALTVVAGFAVGGRDSSTKARVELEQNASIPLHVTLKLGLASTLYPSIEGTAHALASELGITVNLPGADLGPPALEIGATTPIASKASAAVERWTAFGGFWSTAEGIELGDLPSEDLNLYLALEYAESLESLFPVALQRATWLPLEDIERQLEKDASAVTLLPLSTIGPRLRQLSEETVDQKLWLNWEDASLDHFGSLLAERITQPAPVVTTLVFTGDIIPSRCVYSRHKALDDYTAAFASTAEVLRQADITIGSLDAALSDAGIPVDCEETFNLLAPSRSVEGLVRAGFDVISVATNHIKDCGLTGIGCSDRSFFDTLANLEAAGIAPVGGGRDRNEAHSPVIVERNGLRFAFLAYDDVASGFYGAGENTAGTATLSRTAVREDIAAAKMQADVVIVLPQWGAEYMSNPTERQQALGREAIEMGASLVVGNHPHVVQAVEALDEGFVAYALGNFVFDQDWSLETQQSVVLEATFHGARLAGVRLLPVRIVDMYRPTWAGPEEGRAILRRIQKASADLSLR
jgi:poly-gamma-glutamate capsule biosynthesis protein CapA/YwtB (metallophosphatase superfamily)